MRLANRSGAATAVIVGADELAAGTVTVKPMRGDGSQTTIARTDLVDHVTAHLPRNDPR